MTPDALSRRIAWISLAGALTTLGLIVHIFAAGAREDRLESRLAAAESQTAALQDSGLTWAGVALEAHQMAFDHVQRCAWSFQPASDRDGIRDAVLIGCSRREPCRVEWALGDEPEP